MKTHASPLIVIGMHRSGTSLISELLFSMGIFMGTDWEENKESGFFIEMNEWMLRQAGASWQEPGSFLYIPADLRSLMAEILSLRIRSRHRMRYLGMMRHYDSLTELDFQWGWKDPRNTFTWEVWKEVFPGARIIHLYRNPVDAAASLVRRESDFMSGSMHAVQTRTGLKKKYIAQFLPPRQMFNYPFRAATMQGAFEIWKEYVSQAFRIEEQNPGAFLHIGYEDLVLNPTDRIREMVSFCGTDIGDRQIHDLSGKVGKGRQYAFLENQDLFYFYERIKDDPMVKKLGYGAVKV